VALGELHNHDRRIAQEFSDNRLDPIFSARAVERSALLQRIDKIIATDQRLAGRSLPGLTPSGWCLATPVRKPRI
jgi:hypothetical protein